jgi:hypothetical protein
MTIDNFNCFFTHNESSENKRKAKTELVDGNEENEDEE